MGEPWDQYSDGNPKILDLTPKTDLRLQSNGSSDDLFVDLERLLAIAIFVEKGDGILFVDDICFY